MDDKELENRLDFLKNSYDRIPSEDGSDEIIKKIIAQEREQDNQAPKKQKWQSLGTWAIGLASILIFGLIGASFLLEENRQNETNAEQAGLSKDVMIEKVQAIYEKEREQFRKKLGLPEDEFSNLLFVHNADTNIKQLSTLSISSLEGYEQYLDEAIRPLFLLPAEMIEELTKVDSIKTEEEAYLFLNEYFKVIQRFRQYGNIGLAKYEKELEKLKINGNYYLDSVISERKNLPTELQNILRVTESQGLNLVTIDNRKTLDFKFNKDQVFNPHVEKMLYPLGNSYMTWMREYPIDENPLYYTFEYTMEPLVHVEKILSLKDKYNTYSSDTVGEQELTYRRILYDLIKGEQVFDSTRTVDEKYQDMWLKVVSEYPDSLAAFLIKPMIVEFTASGWTKSSSWESFSRDDIKNKLKQFMTGELNMEDNEAILVDDEFVQKVHGLFKLYAGTKDPSLLKNATPEEIVGLFYYSIELKDQETVYSLYSKDYGIQIPKEEYMEGKHIEIEDIRNEFSSFLSRKINEDETVVILTLQEEGNLFNGEKTIGFQLIKTENGWRPPFMPTQ